MKYTATSLKRRVRVFFTVIMCVLTAITGRLVYVQIFASTSMRLLACEQWYRDLPLQARRGNIYDRNGVLMAQSTLTYSIYVRPVAVTDPNAVARVLSDHLGMPFDYLLNKVKNRTSSEHLIKMQVPKEIALDIVSHYEDGIYISQTYNRDYPLGATAGQVMGLVSVDGNGQGGVEGYYNTYIKGINGRSAVASDLRGKPIKDGYVYYTPSVAGNDMHLNIDATIQRCVQDVIARAYDEQGAKSVSALVMDIETGGVVASASAPFYDMNYQPRENVSALLDQIKNLPMTNVLEPGSTFKVLTLASALEEGLTTESELFNCPGFRMVDGERVKCWKTKGHGTQTLAEGVMNSCNCVFMDLALRLGTEKYYEYLKKFHVGQKTGIDTSGEPSGLLLNPKNVRNVDLARIGFGQAIAISPIQFQSVFNACVGDGILKTPRLVNHIDNAPYVVSAPDRGRILSQSTCDRVRKMLLGVVNEGSGKHAGHAGFNIGGKTGTAQKYKDGVIDQGKYISSFIGFIEVNGKAKYSAYLMVDEPSKNGYYGSVVASPYVGQIFGEIIDAMGLKPDKSIKGPFIPEWLALPNDPIKLVEMPNLVGQSVDMAELNLQNLGFYIDIDGEGTNVKSTFPMAGSLLKRGEPVVIFT